MSTRKKVNLLPIVASIVDYVTILLGELEIQPEMLEIVKKHGELKLFADTAKAFDFENFVKGLEWVSKEFSPCVGGCRGGGGWRDCPMRKCCIERGIRFCYECNDFPCETLKFPKRVDELNEIKKMGLESWIKQKLEQNSV